MNPNRWKQRFANFERALALLREAHEKPADALSNLEEEGIVQRFEYTFELAWKTLKDYLEFVGIVLDQATPRHVVKQAFAAGIIDDGQMWIDMLEHRNQMAHTYDEAAFEEAVKAIRQQYLPALDRIYVYLKEKAVES